MQLARQRQLKAMRVCEAAWARKEKKKGSKVTGTTQPPKKI